MGLGTWAWRAGRAALALALAGALVLPARLGAARQQDLDALLDRAYEAAYNLDYEEAIGLARKATTVAPDASRAHRAVASILWFHMIFRRGAVTVDHYMGGVTKSQKSRPKPPADVDAEFRAALDKAIALAEAGLRTAPGGVQEMYDAGAAYALQASYVASVEGSLTSAFRSARRAFDLQETVLKRDPSRTDAGVVVGTYRYLISALNLPTRVFAYMAGFGGGKERGIALLEAALQNPRSRVDAGSALLLVYSREGRHAEAMAVVERLGKRFPRNRLLTLEAGAAAVRAGQAGHAEALLSQGLKQLDADSRPKFPGERAVWLWKRGSARIALNRLADARADFDAALTIGPAAWIEGRIRTDIGKVHDLAGRRAEALAEYARARTLCRGDDDPIGDRLAADLERRPFRFDGDPAPGSR
jgi:tetratricopeptide (TPR) repeat protein